MTNDKIEITEKIIKKSLDSFGTPLIIYDAVYPKIKLESRGKITDIINSHIETISRHKLDYLNRVIVPIAMHICDLCESGGEKFIPFELYSRFTSGLYSDFIFSFYIDSALNKNTYGVTYKKESFTYDLDNGKILKLENLFLKNAHYKEVIFSRIVEQVRLRIESGCDLYKKDWHLKILEFFEPHNFYLSNGGFCFYYEPYTIASGELGYITFIISPYLFGDMLNFKLK